MVELSTENKALCFEDSTKKPLKLFIYYPSQVGSGVSTHEWHYFTTIENAIILESAEIEEGILESSDFALGSFVIPQFKVKWNNDGIKYKNLACIPVQQIGDEYIAYFDGYIKTEELSYADNTVTATIVPFIDKALDIDVKPTLIDSDLLGNSNVAFVIHDALLYGDKITNPNISVDPYTLGQEYFENASLPLSAFATENLPDKITVSDFLKMCGEFLGANIKILGKRKVEIDDMPNYQFGGSYEIPTTEIEFVKLPNINNAFKNLDNKFPEGDIKYEQLEFLQFNNDPYIDTGIVPTNHEITAEYYTPSYFNDNHIFGTADGGFYCHFTEYDRKYFVGTDGREPSGGSWTSMPKTVRFNVGDNNSVYVNEELITSGNYITSTSNLLIGRRTVTNSRFCLKSFKVVDKSTGKLVRDMIPCKATYPNGSIAIGMFDFVEQMLYTSASQGQFIYAQSNKFFELPYYIDLHYDKSQNVKIDGLNLSVKNADEYGQLYYTRYWNSNPQKWYDIKDNIFFEIYNSEDRERALGNVAYSLMNTDFYYADLRSVYTPFAEPNDCLICKSKSSRKIPDDYTLLDYIELDAIPVSDNVLCMIPTGIYPNSENVDLSINFEIKEPIANIFESNGAESGYDTLSLKVLGGELSAYAGYIGGSISNPIFTIEVVPINQKINLNLKISGYDFEYSGIFNGKGSMLSRGINTQRELVLGGYSVSLCKIYDFKYKDDNTEVEMYPCMRKSDKKIGMLDILSNTFHETNGQIGYDYEYADIAVPILSSSASGIHSMIADIRCTATNKK